jgi:hypothetical protein
MRLKNTFGTLCGAMAMTITSAVLAQAVYPAKPVRFIVPSSAGGGTDIVARILSPRMSERLGQQIVIDNRPGAGTMIGIELAAKSPADGYTVLITPSTLALNSAVYKKVPYDPVRDFRAGHLHRGLGQHHRGASLGARQKHQGADRARARARRPAELRLGGDRHLPAHDYGALQPRSRRQDDARAVQRHRACDDRHGRRSHHGHGGDDTDRHAADPGRPHTAARHHQL